MIQPNAGPLGQAVSNDLVTFYLSCFQRLSAEEKAHVLTLTLIYGIHSLQKHGHSLDSLKTDGVRRLENLVLEISNKPISKADPDTLVASRVVPESFSTPATVLKPAAKLTPTFGLYPSWWGHREHAPSKLVQVENPRTGHPVLVAQDFDHKAVPVVEGDYKGEENLRIGGWVTESLLRQQAGNRAPSLAPFEQLTSPLESWRFPKRMVDQITQTNQPYVGQPPLVPTARTLQNEPASVQNYVDSMSSFYSDYSTGSERSSAIASRKKSRERKSAVKSAHAPRVESIIRESQRPLTAPSQRRVEKKPGHWYTITLDEKTGDASVQYGDSKVPELDSDLELENEEILMKKSIDQVSADVTGKLSQISLEKKRMLKEIQRNELGSQSDASDEIIVYSRKSEGREKSHSPSKPSQKSSRPKSTAASDLSSTVTASSSPKRSRPKTRSRRKAKSASLKSHVSSAPSLGSLEGFSVHSKASTSNNAVSGTSALDIALSFLNNNDFINSLDLQDFEET